ncbi:hypothetical protein DVU_3329 [Nitratidesulfovibrio vulgaris str. Hildenborough]|uniref:Uncharacterized protein n=1 Tax=Nitratidesulfovibrio vulgaris (strain ATCC 29579 / DSM 644 / CCUG 34227 / NCIMB 8303 / VKM B-1760 / Hildenborough) TaxID=882 RepID=Q725U6_NITV2|nr:hypothetical protein DVU_3329 [Nitratidesulfovibrio vulgaris str. Hildenborough]
MDTALDTEIENLNQYQSGSQRLAVAQPERRVGARRRDDAAW